MLFLPIVGVLPRLLEGVLLTMIVEHLLQWTILTSVPCMVEVRRTTPHLHTCAILPAITLNLGTTIGVEGGTEEAATTGGTVLHLLPLHRTETDIFRRMHQHDWNDPHRA